MANYQSRCTCGMQASGDCTVVPGMMHVLYCTYLHGLDSDLLYGLLPILHSLWIQAPTESTDHTGFVRPYNNTKY